MKLQPAEPVLDCTFINAEKLLYFLTLVGSDITIKYEKS